MGKSNAQRVAVWQVNLTWIWMLPRSRMEHTACFHVALFTLVWSSVKLYRERFGVEILLYKNRETIWFTNNQSYRFEKLIPHVDTYLMYMCVTVKSLSPQVLCVEPPHHDAWHHRCTARNDSLQDALHPRRQLDVRVSRYRLLCSAGLAFGQGPLAIWLEQW
jgi:hypothetical protein